MIETYFHSGEGYNPFLVREGWQVAQLNYLPGHGFDEIEQIEVHRETDEVFILFKGDAILIEAKPQKDTISLLKPDLSPISTAPAEKFAAHSGVKTFFKKSAFLFWTKKKDDYICL